MKYDPQAEKKRIADALEKAQADNSVTPFQAAWMQDVLWIGSDEAKALDKNDRACAYIWWPDRGPPTGCVDFPRGGGHLLSIAETQDLLKRSLVAYRPCCESMGNSDCLCEHAEAYISEAGKAALANVKQEGEG